MVVGVFERDALKLNFSVRHLDRFRIRRIDDLDRGIHDLQKPFDARHTTLELLSVVDDSSNGEDQRGYVQDIGDHVSDVDLSVYQKHTARSDDDKIHQSVEQSRRGREFCHRIVGFRLGVGEFFVALLELSFFRVLCRERFDDPFPQ